MVERIRWFPVHQQKSKMVGGIFEASLDGETWTTLVTITDEEDGVGGNPDNFNDSTDQSNSGAEPEADVGATDSLSGAQCHDFSQGQSSDGTGVAVRDGDAVVCTEASWLQPRVTMAVDRAAGTTAHRSSPPRQPRR